MTTRNQARESIYSAFVAAWADRTPYYFGNEETGDLSSVSTWARVTVRHTDSERETIGPSANRRYLRRGRLFVQLFRDAEDGTAALDELVELLEQTFEGVTLADSAIYFLAATSSEDGQDGKWYSMTFAVPFWYEQVK